MKWAIALGCLFAATWLFDYLYLSWLEAYDECQQGGAIDTGQARSAPDGHRDSTRNSPLETRNSDHREAL